MGISNQCSAERGRTPQHCGADPILHKVAQSLLISLGKMLNNIQILAQFSYVLILNHGLALISVNKRTAHTTGAAFPFQFLDA